MSLFEKISVESLPYHLYGFIWEFVYTEDGGVKITANSDFVTDLINVNAGPA